jgi:hypothetical protein
MFITTADEAHNRARQTRAMQYWSVQLDSWQKPLFLVDRGALMVLIDQWVSNGNHFVIKGYFA